MLRQFLLGFALAGGISAQACAETVTILMEGVPDTEYVKTLVPEFTKETGIEVNLEVVNYAEMHTDRKSTRLNSSHLRLSRMPSSA